MDLQNCSFASLAQPIFSVTVKFFILKYCEQIESVSNDKYGVCGRSEMMGIRQVVECWDRLSREVGSALKSILEPFVSSEVGLGDSG